MSNLKYCSNILINQNTSPAKTLTGANIQMKNLVKFPILSTCQYNYADGGYFPVSNKYWADINERINYRSLRSPYHITNNNPYSLRKNTPTQQERKINYEVKCLELGLRPFNYPETLWQDYLREVESEEHTARCEAKNSWRYEV